MHVEKNRAGGYYRHSPRKGGSRPKNNNSHPCFFPVFSLREIAKPTAGSNSQYDHRPWPAQNPPEPSSRSAGQQLTAAAERNGTQGLSHLASNGNGQRLPFAAPTPSSSAKRQPPRRGGIQPSEPSPRRSWFAVASKSLSFPSRLDRSAGFTGQFAGLIDLSRSFCRGIGWLVADSVRPG
jgi:hypothetical protein